MTCSFIRFLREGQLAAGQVRFWLQPVFPQVAQERLPIPGDIEHLLAPFQPLPQEGDQRGAVFLFGSMETKALACLPLGDCRTVLFSHAIPPRGGRSQFPADHGRTMFLQ